MKTLTRSALVARLPEQVYALVNDVASYPEFVPGCSAAEVLMRTEREIVARLKVHRGPLSTQLTTRNHLTPHREIRMELVAGPLRALHGLWTFAPVASNGCRIELQLQFEFSNPLKAALLEPLIEGTATSMVQAFVNRAQRRHA
ncbi:MAG: type II toxin-antitoxin system RatA family toxin [Gammaproteobacteria bacterium]|nr:type II toxin-antitoxin system RatA family toxin [Gammaproteobacteria bacterium]MDE2251344.1 type II toxin-antitoxin system RatA family toxin [Gammaproteobacteria bacterium]